MTDSSENPGTLLARSVCKISSKIASRLDENNTISPEEGNKLLFEVVTAFNQEMANNGYITAGAFDILLMAVANYSLLERQILLKSGRDVDTDSRKSIIEKAFKMISTGETLSGAKVQDLVEVEKATTTSGSEG